MRLERVEPDRVLAWRSEDGNWVWTFMLIEASGSTRLVGLNRYRLRRLVDQMVSIAAVHRVLRHGRNLQSQPSRGEHYRSRAR